MAMNTGPNASNRPSTSLAARSTPSVDSRSAIAETSSRMESKPALPRNPPPFCVPTGGAPATGAASGVGAAVAEVGVAPGGAAGEKAVKSS